MSNVDLETLKSIKTTLKSFYFITLLSFSVDFLLIVAGVMVVTPK